MPQRDVRAGRVCCAVLHDHHHDPPDSVLADGVPGVATVVYHAIQWQYLSNVDGARFEQVMAVAGEAATHNNCLPGFVSSRPATLPKSACNSGPAAKSGCWPDPASRGSRCSGQEPRTRDSKQGTGSCTSGRRTGQYPKSGPVRIVSVGTKSRSARNRCRVGRSLPARRLSLCSGQVRR